MNEIQQKAAVAGFIHALRHSPAVRDEWFEIRKTRDWTSLRGLIGRTVGLAQAPTEEELNAMSRHAQAHLMPQLTELQQLDQRMEPLCVCNGGYCPPYPPGS
jgi:hypothetical protein